MSDVRTAICPGTYDPVTNGHLDIIGRAANVFDRVVVGVVNQPTRKETTLFTAEERRAFIDDAVSRNGLGNVEVEIFSACSSSSRASTARPRSSRGCGRSPTSSTSSR